MKDSKPRLILVDGNARLRVQIVEKLSPLYTVQDFALLSEALRYTYHWVPDLLVLSANCAQGSYYYGVEAIRLDPVLAMLPIIILLDENSPEQRDLALRAGATSCLAKPYKLSSMTRAISSALNQSVEKRWESLPQLQAEALRSSIAVFRSVTDRIAAGQTIPYQDIGSACQPLLEAVNADAVKLVLQGVRDHDDYTYSHSLRVAMFLAMFGRDIGLSRQSQNVLTIGGLLHDLGKIDIPPLILNKPGRLKADEFEVMKGHVPATLRLLEHCTELPRAAIIIAAQHHEKMDGTGYPNGLTGAKLNELARMAAIADVFSALTDRRVYKRAIPPERAFKIMSEEMQPHLDMHLLEKFRQMLLDTRLY